jgi:heme exporter protein C
VPLNFLAVRLAQSYTHPRIFATANGGLEPRMKVAFYVCLLGMALLYATLWKYEMTSKNTSAQIKRLRRRLAGDEIGAPRRSAAPTLEST